MSLKQYFVPEKLATTKSKINKDIEIVNFGGHRRLDMGGLTQSGRIIEDIWNHGFKKLLLKGFAPQSALILGFGAGSAARLIHRRWPQCAITGVELDPQVIKLGKEYFSTDQIPHLRIVNADAYSFVYHQRSKRYDLILVDCYLGDQIPPKLQLLSFYLHLSHLSDYILINRLFWGKYQPPTINFLNRLETKFATTTTRTASNFLISIKKAPVIRS